MIARLKAAANRAEAAELDRLRAEVAALPGTRVGLFDAASPPPLARCSTPRRSPRRTHRTCATRTGRASRTTARRTERARRGTTRTGRSSKRTRGRTRGSTRGGDRPLPRWTLARSGPRPDRGLAEPRASRAQGFSPRSTRTRHGSVEGETMATWGEGDRRGAPPRICSRRAPRRGPSRTLATRVREFITYHHRVRGELD